MISIDQPAMALNAPDCPPPMRMWNTWEVQSNFKRHDIIGWVTEVAKNAPGGKLKSLVICSHATPGNLLIGEGFTRRNTPLFKAWRNLVDMIFLQGCAIAAGEGYSFCSEMAVYASCCVVASTRIQEISNSITTMPYGKIDIFEGMTITFGPNGKAVNKLQFPNQWVAD
jgi:hypothetical protein